MAKFPYRSSDEFCDLFGHFQCNFTSWNHSNATDTNTAGAQLRGVLDRADCVFVVGDTRRATTSHTKEEIDQQKSGFVEPFVLVVLFVMFCLFCYVCFVMFCCFFLLI